MTVTDTGTTALATRDELLDEASVTGLDLDAARSAVDALAGGRRRLVRSGVAALAVAALVGVGVLALVGEDDPDELLADRSERTSTTTSTASTTTTSVTTTSPVAPIAPPTTTPTTLAPTTTTATTTTVPVNQPLQAEARWVADRVPAGEVATLEVSWVDPDHSGGEPEMAVEWGDPAVTALPGAAPGPSCDAPGASGGGVLRRDFRYATPGTHPVRIVLTTCGGEGAYAERRTVETAVTVDAATIDGSPAVAVVAVAPRTADGLPVLPGLDAALATLEPTDPSSPTVDLAPRTPLLVQFGTSGPATVLRLPAGAIGTLRLRWPSSPCESTSAVDLSGPLDGAPVLALTSAC